VERRFLFVKFDQPPLQQQPGAQELCCAVVALRISKENERENVKPILSDRKREEI
jgi:hypothetical protein